MIVRAPIDAPGPIATNGPIDAPGPIVASAATLLRRSIPGGGGGDCASSATACANARYGFSARTIAHDAAAASSPGLARPRMIADARVCRMSV
jgi:hypothetical protein